MKLKANHLIVTYGLTLAQVIPLISLKNPDTQIDAGWITLHLEWDQYNRPVVFAEAATETFLLCARAPLHAVRTQAGTSPKHKTWVYGVYSLPTGFCDRSYPTISMATNGFNIEIGRDAAGRAFALVSVPGYDLRWLFRDPASSSSAAFNAPPALVADHGQQINPNGFAPMSGKVAGADVKRETSGDAELDALIGQLG